MGPQVIPNILNRELVVDQIGQRGRGREEAGVIEHGAQATPESVTDVRALGTTSDAYPGQPGNQAIRAPRGRVWREAAEACNDVTDGDKVVHEIREGGGAAKHSD